MKYFPLWDILLMHLLCVWAVKFNMDFTTEVMANVRWGNRIMLWTLGYALLFVFWDTWCPDPCDWWSSWLSSWLSLASRQGDKFWPVVGQQRAGRTDRSQSVAQREAPVRTNGSDALLTSRSPSLMNFPPYTERSQPQVWKSRSIDLFYDRWV